MSRSDRRKEDRECKKHEKALVNLTPKQRAIMDFVTDAKADELTKIQVDKINAVVERSIESVLLLNDMEPEQIQDIEKELAELIKDDAEKIEKYNKGDITMKPITEELRKRIEELIELGMKKKDAIKTLIFDFPTCSKNMLTLSYQDILSEKKKEQKQIDAAVKSIFEEEEEMSVNKAEVKEETKAIETIQEEVKEVYEAITEGKTSLKPILMGGKHFVYIFNPEGVAIESGQVGNITEEHIAEQQEAFRIWKENYK